LGRSGGRYDRAQVLDKRDRHAVVGLHIGETGRDKLRVDALLQHRCIDEWPAAVRHRGVASIDESQKSAIGFDAVGDHIASQRVDVDGGDLVRQIREEDDVRESQEAEVCVADRAGKLHLLVCAPEVRFQRVNAFIAERDVTTGIDVGAMARMPMQASDQGKIVSRERDGIAIGLRPLARMVGIVNPKMTLDERVA
jgi:hypothetical protein